MTETYLEMFEDAIRQQAELVGEARALEQARKAGLGVSPEGRIVSCAGNCTVVLLRLIRSFTEDGNLAALARCRPLIDEMEKLADRLNSESPEPSG